MAPPPARREGGGWFDFPRRSGQIEAAETRLARVPDLDGDVLRARTAALLDVARGRPADALAAVQPLRRDFEVSGLGYSEVELLEVELLALDALGLADDSAAAAARLDELRARAADPTG